ncbi:MAG: hypothetical protein HC905_20660 [Bacteroidales bacterium]|nr:hypothetical protein [Bacteroidales bacterium]
MPGNANVVLYNFGEKTFTSSTSYPLAGITTGYLDSCIVYAYYKVSAGSSYWYPVPGIGAGNAYEVRSYFFKFNLFCKVSHR